HLLREMLAARTGTTLGSSSLGGCPASCPDTYRLTHDHRHVRNWARLEIRLLILLRNNFFRLGTDFPMRAYKLVLRRARPTNKHEWTLRFLPGARALQRLCRSAFLNARVRRA